MPKTKQMTESEAWLIVAAELEAGKTSQFLCHAIRGRSYNEKRTEIDTIPQGLRSRMRKFLRDVVSETEGVAYYKYEGCDSRPLKECMLEERAGRVTACLLFSEMAKDHETWIEEAV